MATGAYSTINNRRDRLRRQRNGENDESMKEERQYSNGDHSTNGNGNGGRREKFFTNSSLFRGFDKRPNIEWDFRDFNVIVAKGDEQAIAAGLEKMISQRRLLASYNWDEKSWFPTIVVPGAPKIFYPWSGGVIGNRDEVMTIDEESFRIPNAPMEPLFTAVRLCQPNFKLGDVDLVADLNCLKKLLRFVLRAAFMPVTDEDEDTLAKMEGNISCGGRDTEFRIDGQVLGQTIVLMRREAEHRGRAMGYGVAYQDACIRPYDTDPKASGPHKRVTFVKFGNLRLLLRHKTLAAIYPTATQTTNGNTSVENDDSGDGNWPSSMTCSSVRYIRGGYLGNHAELRQIEFASLSKVKSRLVIDKWLDMLFTGSDDIYVGEHSHGRFDQPILRSRAEALEMSGIKPADGRRILVSLEMLLSEFIIYGRRSAMRAQGKMENGFGQGRGDGKSRQNTNTMEPFSFSIVSLDECRKLALYIHEPGRCNRRSDANVQSCMSEPMMAALLAEDSASKK